MAPLPQVPLECHLLVLLGLVGRAEAVGGGGGAGAMPGVACVVVAAWNIMRAASRLAEMLEIMMAAVGGRPDIVMLQEVGTAQGVQELAATYGYQWFPGQARPDGLLAVGCLVAEDLGQVPVVEPSTGWIKCTIALQRHTLSVINGYSPGRGTEAQQDWWGELGRALARESGQVIVVGDFNTWWGEQHPPERAFEQMAGSAWTAGGRPVIW